MARDPKPPRPNRLQPQRSGPPLPPKFSSLPQRLTNPVRTGASQHRAESRMVKREAVREIASQRMDRPRPTVRPAAPPRKVMPKQPAPVRPELQSVTKTRPARVRPLRPSSGKPPAPRPAVVAAAGIGAAASAATLMMLSTANAHQEISTEVSSLNSSLEDLRERSSLRRITNDIHDLDERINRVAVLLESAREKGYCYQGDLEPLIYEVMSAWENRRPEALEEVRRQADLFQPHVMALNPQVQRLNQMLHRPTAALPVLQTLETQVNSLLSQVSTAESDIERVYAGIEANTNTANTRLTEIHWAFEQLAESHIKLANGENLVMAVKNRWDQEGKNDPEGILYLTDQRLIFERKEKVATKKILFITTQSELIQEVLIDQPVNNIHSSKADSRGLFGHQDYLLLELSDPSLKEVAFHIDGQDSKRWEEMIQRVRSGDLVSEKVSASGGLSVRDMTRPLTAADVMAVQSEVNELQDELMLKTAHQELSALESEVYGLERKLAGLRSRGFAIEKNLEADVTILGAQWARIKQNAEETLTYQTQVLGEQMRLIQKSLGTLAGRAEDLTAARPVYMQLKSSIASAQAQADAAEDTVLAQYDSYADEVEALDAHLEWVDWMLDAQETASFRFLATEAGVAAVEAVYQFGNLEPENGVLFLTDQRLLWEDRVGDFELKVDVPLQEVEDIRKEMDETQGFESLVVRLGANSQVAQARFQLGMPVADDWIKMVGRARSGGYLEDRAVPVSEEELERIRNAPIQCSNCGASFTDPILRGQTELRCEYCGLVTRI